MAKRKFTMGSMSVFDKEVAKDLNMKLMARGHNPQIKKKGKGYEIYI